MCLVFIKARLELFPGVRPFRAIFVICRYDNFQSILAFQSARIANKRRGFVLGEIWALMLCGVR